ncbi:MAG: ribonuclease III [Proteobacteria bacterium]|nr:ribonuclease III [Pseudomonadota bacterium]
MVDALEARLGYTFANKALLREALNREGGARAWQRLEFLGDRVLGLVVGEWLFERFPGADEGELSRRLTAMVRESTLAKVGDELGLAGHLRLASGEVPTPSVIADGVEALLGAVWRDGGLEQVRLLVRRELEHMLDAKDEKDAKTRVQEWLQRYGLGLPTYAVVAEDGPDHDKWFKVKVSCVHGEAEGEGKTKQVAGLAAAERLMEILEARDE